MSKQSDQVFKELVGLSVGWTVRVGKIITKNSGQMFASYVGRIGTITIKMPSGSMYYVVFDDFEGESFYGEELDLV